MAERVAERAAAEAGITDVEFRSAATSTEELGEPMDLRAASVLARRGYRHDRHRAHQLNPEEIATADLVIGMEDIHIRKMLAMAPGSTNLSRLSDYDSSADPGSGVPDPWYGSPAGFYDTLDAIEAAMPGIVDRIRQIQVAKALR